jgi:hypothetical protein
LESVANAHTAADLHVRPVSKTALVKIVGAASTSRNTRCAISRNPFDERVRRVMAVAALLWFRVTASSF